MRAFFIRAVLVVWALAGVASSAPVRAEPACRLAATAPLTPVGPATVFGGLSDLWANSPTIGSPRRLWAITDRGPNGTWKTAAGKRRTLLAPDFVPHIVAIDVETDAAGHTVARLGETLPLAGRSGRPLSGRPNGIGNDEPILDAAGEREIPPDANGVDTEGLVRLSDGTFWLAEEYRPSLLRVAADGRVLARYVPEGHALPGADMDVHDVLPAAYGSRRDNRGFEALAVSPDDAILWALLQSPLDHPAPKAGRRSGNVRMVAFDIRHGRVAAEFVYRLGDPSIPAFLTDGAPPDDGKLCAMAAIDARTLLVLEQADGGLARLYRCSLADATDTLGRPATPAIEEVRDLPAAGIVPVRKELVADLAGLRPAMLRDVYGESDANDDLELKLEGMAILDPNHVAIVNDNDFGVHAPKGSSSPPRSCLWVVEVGEEALRRDCAP